MNTAAIKLSYCEVLQKKKKKIITAIISFMMIYKGILVFILKIFSKFLKIFKDLKKLAKDEDL